MRRFSSQISISADAQGSVYDELAGRPLSDHKAGGSIPDDEADRNAQAQRIPAAVNLHAMHSRCRICPNTKNKHSTTCSMCLNFVCKEFQFFLRI